MSMKQVIGKEGLLTFSTTKLNCRCGRYEIAFYRVVLVVYFLTFSRFILIAPD